MQVRWVAFQWIIKNVKQEQKLFMLIVMSLYFSLLVLKQVNAAVAVTISIIHMQKCVPDVVKNLNVKVFNLMSRTNETRHIK